MCDLLMQAGYAIRELRMGEDVLSAAAEVRPVLVVLDVSVNGLNGYEVCRQLRALYGNSVAIVFVSGERTEAVDRVAGLLLGADDYIVKPFDSAELIARVRRLTSRVHMHPVPARSNQALESLTEREGEVLTLLARGYRPADIADELFISRKTVATHIQRVIKKLGVHDRTQAVALALNGTAGERLAQSPSPGPEHAF
jgi:DNA-binding NarL/FixJ family response regulator